MWWEGVIVLLAVFVLGCGCALWAAYTGYCVGIKSATETCEKLHGPAIDQGD